MPEFSRFRQRGTHTSGQIDDEQAIEFDDLHKKSKQPGDTNADDIQTAPWKALFFFTTKKHLTCLSIAVTTAVLSGIASPAAALLVGKAFQGFATATNGNDLVKKESKYALYLLLVGLASWLLHFIFFAAWVTFGELQANSARNRLFNGLLIKEIEWYDLRKSGVGALIPRLQVQIRELQLAAAQPFGSLVTTVATACFNIGLAMYYSWKLTLVIISTVPLITIVLGYLGTSMQPNVKRQQEQLTTALKYVNNALAAIETVKCFNGQDKVLENYSHALVQATLWYLRVVNSNALQFAFTSFMASAMFVQGFYYGGVLVRDGQKSAGDVVTTFVAALGAFQAISGILPQMIVLEKGRTAGATLRAVMTQINGGSTVSRERGYSNLDSCEGNISLKNISFAYPARPDQMALRDVSMFIPGGCMTFVIGQSGSGKSTIGQLLMRLYRPSSGEILFDGIPLAKLDLAWLRSHITLVEQHSNLFEGTVFDNIALGKCGSKKATRAEVLQAVEFALLQLMVNDMAKGIDTMIGSKESSMSGGQRQRMALARAFVRDTPVLLLDESTSALDQISRSLMMDAIRRWRQGKTTIVITHDISQILPNDYAVVLRNGRLVQEGYRMHMERLKDGSFQDFLSEEQQAELSPFDSRRHRSVDLSIRLASFGNPELPPYATVYIDDPLETHLTAGEKKRASFLPTAFTNAHTSLVLQGVSKFGRPVSTYKPTLSFVPMKTDTTENRQKIRPVTRTISDKRQTTSQKEMEDFIGRTGTLAAQARFQDGRQRHRLYSEPVLDFTPAKRQSLSFWLEKCYISGKKHRNGHGVEVQSTVAILRTVWPNLDWPVRILMIVGFMCAAIGAAITPVFSFILSRLIQTYGQGASGQHMALIYSLAILGLSGATATCAYFQHVFLEYAGQRWVNRIRELALERVLDQPRDFFNQEENSVSRITEGLDRHAEEMRNLLGRFAAVVLTATIMITVSLVWALITQWKITLIALSVGPYVWAVTRAYGTVSSKWEAKCNDASEATGAIFFETFTSIKTVRALTLEAHFSNKYFKATRDNLKTGFKRALWSGFFFGLSDSSGDFVMALIFYAGGVIVRDSAPAGKVIQVFIQLIITINNISNLLNFIPQMSAAKDMASRILRLSQLPKDSHEHMGNTRVTSIGDIIFTDLTFSYPSRPNQIILNRVNFSIISGNCTAIVGSSGSGKSTIAALLLRLYTTAPELGTVRSVPDLMVSGRDIKHIYTPTLRSLVTVVAQSPVIFATTVAENITYGLPNDSPHTSMTAIREAAAAAGIDDFIMTLPDAYATAIGEGGIGLSGGQAQRVAIARALVRKPAVLILDEATSALDVESAGLIRQTIHSLVETEKERMTVIIITHSRDMMAVAENIIVLDHGEVVEQGPYAELVTQRGALSNLLSCGEWDAGPAGRKSSIAVQGLTENVDWAGTSASPRHTH